MPNFLPSSEKFLNGAKFKLSEVEIARVMIGLEERMI
jgi:hypothetical protein